MVKTKEKTSKLFLTTEEKIIEQLVKEDHVFRKLNEIVNFEEILDPYYKLYSDIGVEGINVVKGFKTLLIQFWEDYSDREKIYTFIRSEIKNGHQAFFIFPLIEESEKIEGKAATEEYKNLSENIFPDLKIGLLHGRMPAKGGSASGGKPSKEQVMNDFKNKKLNILVSTSVIEVGVDVPNATIMVIEGSERFGLAQLHQFRGRVGRSRHQSYCFLFTDSNSKTTSQRLNALIESEDGFKLAEKDLEIRGPGQFLGTRQSGRADSAMQYLGDIKLIQQARLEAQSVFALDPKLSKFPVLKNTLEEMEKDVHLE